MHPFPLRTLFTALFCAAGTTAVCAGEPPEIPSPPTALVAADFSTSYIYRGLTLCDAPVFEPYMEVYPGPFTFGAWGNYSTGDYDGRARENRFTEMDIYARATLPLRAVSLTAGLIDITYPGSPADDDLEFSVAAKFPVLLTPTLTANYGASGAINRIWFITGACSHKFVLRAGLSLKLSAELAWTALPEGAAGVPYGAIGGELSWKRFRFGLKYWDRLDSRVLPDAGPDASGFVRPLVATFSICRCF